MAERHFQAAVAVNVEDNYVLAAYADFLLENGRPGDVIKLLAGRESSDTLLLRLALAARQLGSAEAARYTRTLGERFRESALRGERLHLAEEARFLLDLEGKPREALAAAVENWRTQREPRDAEILLDAALAAGDRSAAAPALEWLRSSGYEGRRARELAARLTGRT